MAYRFLKTDKDVEAGLRRIACDQVDKAIASLDSFKEDGAHAVHDVRKRCKKLRGLVRVVRPAFGAYKQENAAFRDVANLLGGLRDAKVMQDTYDAVMADYDGAVDRAAIAPVRRRLTQQRQEQVDEADLEERLSTARQRLGAARKRAEHWELEEKGWDALSGGIGKTYGRARKAMAKAAKKPTGERHHEWRKRVKYHWYHARLMRCVWPGHMKERAGLAHDLAELLGDHHDCHVFEQTIAADPVSFASAEAVETLIGLTRSRRALLEEQAHRLGARLLSEDAETLLARWGQWWRVWSSEGELHEAALTRWRG